MWKDFIEPEFELPNIVLERKLEGFEDATQALAKIRIVELTGFNKKRKELSKAFQHILVLSSRFIPGYSFEVLSFSFEVDGYPTEIIVEDGIGDELEPNRFDGTEVKYYPNSQEDLEAILDKIFETKKFNNVVGGIMKLARSGSKNHVESDLPF
jgi:hypothetical protein